MATFPRKGRMGLDAVLGKDRLPSLGPGDRWLLQAGHRGRPCPAAWRDPAVLSSPPALICCNVLVWCTFSLGELPQVPPGFSPGPFSSF